MPAEDEGDDAVSKAWWQHPTVIGAFIAGIFGIPAVLIQVLKDDDGDGGNVSVQGVEASLESTVREFYVACPTTIVFDGRISVSGGAGEVAYRFVHVDAFGGAEVQDPVRSVSFDGAGSAPVRHEWTPTVPEGEVFRTAAIEILRPVSIRSNDVTVTGVCDSSLPAGPPVPPPDVDSPSG